MDLGGTSKRVTFPSGSVVVLEPDEWETFKSGS